MVASVGATVSFAYEYCPSRYVYQAAKVRAWGHDTFPQ